jgi:hypothetical protein
MSISGLPNVIILDKEINNLNTDYYYEINNNLLPKDYKRDYSWKAFVLTPDTSLLVPYTNKLNDWLGPNYLKNPPKLNCKLVSVTKSTAILQTGLKREYGRWRRYMPPHLITDLFNKEKIPNVLLTKAHERFVPSFMELGYTHYSVNYNYKFNLLLKEKL